MRVLGTEDFSQSCPRALRQPFWAQLSSGGHPGGLANRVIHFSEQFVGSAFEFRSSSWMEFRSDIRLEDIPQFFQALGKHLDRVVNMKEEILMEGGMPFFQFCASNPRREAGCSLVWDQRVGGFCSPARNECNDDFASHENACRTLCLPKSPYALKALHLREAP